MSNLSRDNSRLSFALVLSIGILGSLLSAVPTSFAEDTQRRQLVRIYPNTVGELTIARDMYGVNNSWNNITRWKFAQYYESAQATGATMMRYPGGWDSEWYDWQNNWVRSITNESGAVLTWKRAPAADDEPGAAPWRVKRKLLQSSRTGLFVLPTIDYVCNPNVSIENLRQKVGDIVAAHRHVIRHWEIGNEWFFFGRRCGDSRKILRARYATIALEFAQEIKDVDDSAKIYLTGDWNTAGGEDSDFAWLKTAFKGHWGKVAGVSVHVYTGVEPKFQRNHRIKPHPISMVTRKLRKLRSEIGESKKIFATEWAPSRLHNQNDNYLAAANHMVDLLYAMMRGRVDKAVYWPGVKGVDEIALLSEEGTGYVPTAVGQAFDWLSSSLKKNSVPANWESDGPSAAVARKDNRLTIFIQGHDYHNSRVRLRVYDSPLGVEYNVLRSAHVLYNSNPQSEKRAVQNKISDIEIFNVDGSGYTDIDFVINPAVVDPDKAFLRGSSHEIARIVVEAL